MELSSSEIYKSLQPLAKANDASIFIAALRELCANKIIMREAADNLLYTITSSLFHLATHELLDEGVKVVEAALEICADLPISAEKRWYFVAKALTIIKSRPELAQRLASQIIRDTVTEEYDFVSTVELFAQLGCRDLALAFALKAIAFNFDFAITTETLIASKKIYDQDENFKNSIDSALFRQSEKRQRIANPTDFFSTLEAAEDAIHNLRLSYSNPQHIFALLAFTQPQYRGEIEHFLTDGFQQLKNLALSSSKLIDHTLVNAIARAIGNWGDPAFGDVLMQEFNFVIAEVDKDDPDYIPRHYELNQTCGTIALSLACLDYAGDISSFDNFLQSFAWRYPGSDFVMQVHYAKWLLTKDAEGAVAFLADAENKKGASYAVSALADLDHKAALTAIKHKQASLRHPITQEVFKEAIARLEQQKQPPVRQDRMIALFGQITLSEMALGAESDNIFLLRAQQRLKNPQLGTIYDEEYLAPED